jgi:LuxR family maltose regulon positive regulatory protein
MARCRQDKPVDGTRRRLELQDVPSRANQAPDDTPGRSDVPRPRSGAGAAQPGPGAAGQPSGAPADALVDVAPRDRGAMQRSIAPRLQPPVLAANCVPRPALLTRIDTALSSCRVILLTAPIGAGKTTLLAQWYRHAAARRGVAWLTLEPGDSASPRFFADLADALRAAVPEGRAAAGPALPADPAGLAAALAQWRRDLVIVLDAFEWLAETALLPAIDGLLQRSPAHVHWVIAGRCLPGLNLGVLRLNDQLATLGAADLNFDSELIEQLARRLCRRPLSRPEADGIQSRTEGWVAGVKLALLAREDLGMADQAPVQFTGSHYEVARYLGPSVLQAQPAELRDFLVATSVVDRMCADLCNALLGITHGQMLLDQAERAQLFIQPLDRHGRWYRYHTLFLDFLRSCLRRDAARLPLLHERASRWFAAQQLHDEALQHAFAGSDARWRLQLLAGCTRRWLQGGEIADVIRWCEKLPRAEVMGHPELCEAYIVSLILSRHFDAALAALREVEAAGADPQGAVRLLRAMLRILSDSSSADGLVPDEALWAEGGDSFLRGNLLTLQAYATLRRCRFDIAWRLAMRARDTFEGISTYGFGYASVVAALAERAQGDVKSAARRCELMFAQVRGGRRNPAWVNAATALAHVRYEENRLADAETLCAEVLPLLSMASTVEDLVTAYLTLARIQAINERGAEALQLLDYLHSVLEGGRHERFLAQVCGEKIRLWLAQGLEGRARAAAAELGLPQMAQAGAWQAARPYDEAWERLGLAHAWLCMQAQDHAQAVAVLAVLRDSAHAVGYVYRELALEAALAHGLWCCGEQEAAFEALNRGLALTRGHGFPRSVFDDTPGVVSVLVAAVRQRRLRQPLPARYMRKFENLLGPGAGPGASPAPAAGARATLPLEPLTDREIDMLRLLARGLSNQEISAHSQIALSTAKWHLKNVFAKLDVSTRTGALARARELGLID